MYRLHQERLRLPCPRGLQAEARIPVPFQGVEEERYTLLLEPSLPPLQPAAFISASHLLIRPGLKSSQDCIHPPAHTSQRSHGVQASANVDDVILGTRKGVLLALIFPLVLNWYLLWRSGSSWQHSVARDDVGLAFLKVQSSA